MKRALVMIEIDVDRPDRQQAAADLIGRQLRAEALRLEAEIVHESICYRPQRPPARATSMALRDQIKTYGLASSDFILASRPDTGLRVERVGDFLLPDSTLGRQIRQRRSRLGWSRHDLACHANVDDWLVGSIEHDDIRGEDQPAVAAIQQALTAAEPIRRRTAA